MFKSSNSGFSSDLQTYRNYYNSMFMRKLVLLLAGVMALYLLHHHLFSPSSRDSFQHLFYFSFYWLVILWSVIYFVVLEVIRNTKVFWLLRGLNLLFYTLTLVFFMVLGIADYRYGIHPFTFSIVLLILNLFFRERIWIILLVSSILTGIICSFLWKWGETDPFLVIFEMCTYSGVSIFLSVVANRWFVKVYAWKVKYENSLDNLEKMNTLMGHDLEVAINTQRSFIPHTVPDVKGWDIALYSRPVSGVSGDFHDFYTKNKRLQGVSLFDVSGHGISAALLTIHIKSLLFYMFTEFKSKGLGCVIDNLNLFLQEEVGSSSHFLTGILLKINKDSVDYLNAGHPDALVRRFKDGKVSRLYKRKKEDYNTILGVNFGFSEWKSFSCPVGRGDVIFLFSDGLYEKNEVFKNNELIKYALFQETAGSMPSDASAEEYCKAIIEKEKTCRGTLADDITLVVMKKI